jgi:flagellin-like hook-associated protein FlgL
MGNLRTESKKLSNNLSIITAREDFTSQMINTLGDGAAKLTEADLNEEGANMLMLQTRQALSTTSLNIASQAAQNVLRLF